MKKFENDNMNYDENGYYSGDSENSGMDYNNKHGFEPNEGFIKIVNGIAILGVLIEACGFYNYCIDKGSYIGLYFFFGIPLTIGFFGLITKYLGCIKNSTFSLIFSMFLGIAGMIGTKVMTGIDVDDKTNALLHILFIIAVSFCVTVWGLIYSIKRARTIRCSKENCTQSILAKCVNPRKHRAQMGDIIEIYYRPQYQYKIDGKIYKVGGMKTYSDREEGVHYEIFIDPEVPTVYYDPEAEDEGIMNIILSSLLYVGLPGGVLLYFTSILLSL